MKYLLIIPARGGSKGIKNKNIININGHPLIKYTIKAALAAQKKLKNSKVIVSTDSKKIREISINCGANVPFLRSRSISNDKSLSSEYISHALKYFLDKNQFIENIIILQPTSPLRTKENIIKAVKLFEQNSKETLISAYKENYLNDKGTYRLVGNYGKPNSIFHNKGGRRQDDRTTVVRNGAIYIFDVKFFIKEKKIISDSPLIYLMKKSQSINIDTYDELFLAEKMLQILLKKNIKNKNLLI